MIIDTHCHLNFNLFDEDLDDVLSRARSAGVVRIVVPAIDLKTSMDVIELSQRIPEVYAAVGIHPNEAASFTLHDLDKLHDLAKNQKIVALGEIGLDKYHNDVELGQQIFAFEGQLDLAKELKLPVLVHNREADKEIGTILKDRIDSDKVNTDLHGSSGIMHAFSSSVDFARLVIALGFSIGASGAITFKNAGDKKLVFKDIDKNQIVIETDAPFLTPQPFRGKRNEPAYTVYVAEELSKIWAISIVDVLEITTRNAARIFQWTKLN